MTTLCFHHQANIDHDPGPDHSERAGRVIAIMDALKKADLPNLVWSESPLGNRADIERVHTHSYANYIFNSVPESGYQPVEINEVVSEDDGGEVTTLSSQSGNAVLRSVGGMCAAVDALAKHTADNAFCITRPPGHHACTNKSMGFCVFNNVAIAAKYAQQVHGFKKIAIIDFDVHHGNGTQQIFEQDPSIFFASIHQSPLWPESGFPHETGVGNILNVTTAPDLPRQEWLKTWRAQILTRLDQENFDFMMISAGFDAHKDDPKGSQNLLSDDFFDITTDLLHCAQERCNNRVLSALEGGYNFSASAEGAAAHVRALCSFPKISS